MKAHWPSGDVVQTDRLTEEQWASLERLQKSWDLPDPVEVQPGLGYVGIWVDLPSHIGSWPRPRMFIGIERDGYTAT